MSAEYVVFVATIEPSQSGKTGKVLVRHGGQRKTIEAAMKKAHSINPDNHFVWIESNSAIVEGKVAHVDHGSRIKILP